MHLFWILYTVVTTLAIMIYYITINIKENFSAAPDNPIIRDMSKNAYYNEIDNFEYEKLLRESFAYPCYKKSIAADLSQWLSIALNDPMAAFRYKKLLEYVEKKVNKGPLVKDPVESIQLTNSTLINQYRHKTQSGFYKFEFNIVLYTEGKFHGKEVNIVALTKGSIIDIIKLSITGIVPEDRIVLLKNDDINGFAGYPNDQDVILE